MKCEAVCADALGETMPKWHFIQQFILILALVPELCSNAKHSNAPLHSKLANR